MESEKGANSTEVLKSKTIVPPTLLHCLKWIPSYCRTTVDARTLLTIYQEYTIVLDVSFWNSLYYYKSPFSSLIPVITDFLSYWVAQHFWILCGKIICGNYIKDTGLSCLMLWGVSGHNENVALSISKEGFSNSLTRLLANVSPLSINEAISRLRAKILIILVISLR